MGNRCRRGDSRLHRGVSTRRSDRRVRRRPHHPVGASVRAALAAGLGGGCPHHGALQPAARHRREGDARPHPDRLARSDARGGELADPLVPAAARQPHRLLHPAGIRAADPQGPQRAGRRSPHEPDAWAPRGRGGLRHGVVAPPASRHAGRARAGRLRSRGRGAASGVRDPRDRARPPVGVLDPSRLDPRPADVTPPAVVELAGVQVTYDRATVLDVPALGVRPSEILAVVGPNGSGKSTLLRVIGLLERPTRGAVRFHDRPVDARHSLVERRRMATVFQRPLLADMTVAENVALGLRFRGAGLDANGTRVERWLERLNIAPLRAQRARAAARRAVRRARRALARRASARRRGHPSSRPGHHLPGDPRPR
ncbi:MAG: hypothetical protein DMD99_13965 [Candidatus Rokuibacteriota bacterium]|nr:MAG: hypothetical protein DMD99_13965 [Candidatus Rokubacteria bacterium]